MRVRRLLTETNISPLMPILYKIKLHLKTYTIYTNAHKDQLMNEFLAIWYLDFCNMQCVNVSNDFFSASLKSSIVTILKNINKIVISQN